MSYPDRRCHLGPGAGIRNRPIERVEAKRPASTSRPTILLLLVSDIDQNLLPWD